MLLGMAAQAQNAAPTHLVDQPPTTIREVAPGIFLADFGRVAFGNLAFILPQTGPPANLTVRFGEALKNGRIDSQPPGSIRFSKVQVLASAGDTTIVMPPADTRNTTPPAVRTTAAWGTLTPFRWVEIEGWPATLRGDQIYRRAAFDSTWNDDDATFHSSDRMLDRVWDLCHYSIKATTYAGLFVDGDRERIAYEADAYLNQLGYYDGNPNPLMPRVTFDRLMKEPTWPSEWAPHMVFMAYADWMQNGDSTLR